MFENIGNINRVDDIKVNEKNLNMLIQIMVDVYLKKINSKPMKEILKEKNVEGVPGVLYNYHIIVLQDMLLNEFKLMGYNLVEVIKNNNETFEPGKLSNYETKILLDKISYVDGLLAFTEKNYNN